MVETWPATLPDSPLIADFSEEIPDTSIRTEMESGLDKVRRRWTSSSAEATWTFILTASQVDDLLTFYKTTLKSGTLTFNRTSPMSGDTKEYRMREAPKISPVSHNLWHAELPMEILP